MKMKYSAILKMTLLNSLILMLIGSFLASCNQQSTQTSSYYELVEKQIPKRSIASVKKKNDHSVTSYIYCQNNSLTPRRCLKSKIIGLNLEQEELLSHKIAQINKMIFSEYETYISQKIGKSFKSCLTTHEKKVERCLKDYTETANQQILNKITKDKVKKINPDEILYLKKVLKKHLEQMISQNLALATGNKVSVIDQEIKKQANKIKKSLLTDTQWLRKINGISIANQKCINTVNSRLSSTPDTNLLIPELQKSINKHICLPVLSSTRFIKILNENTNSFIESKLADLQSNIDKNVTKMISKCRIKGEVCFNDHWRVYSKSMTDYTLSQFQEQNIKIDIKVIKHKLDRRKDRILKKNKI